MSIELAVAWACRTLRIQQAADDAAHMFEQAARDDKRATILVSGQLSKDGKGWLARWTGSDVVVAELTQRQQAGLGLKPGAMSQHLERAVDSSAQSLLHDLTLADVTFDAGRARADQPLVGGCSVSFNSPRFDQLAACALRAEYFQPDFSRQVTGYWHFNEPIWPGHREHRFALPPSEVSGLVVVFLQIVTARDWQKLDGLRALSNTTAVVVEIKAG